MIIKTFLIKPPALIPKSVMQTIAPITIFKTGVKIELFNDKIKKEGKVNPGVDASLDFN